MLHEAKNGNKKIVMNPLVCIIFLLERERYFVNKHKSRNIFCSKYIKCILMLKKRSIFAKKERKKNPAFWKCLHTSRNPEFQKSSKITYV